MALARRMAGFTESPTLRASTIARTLRAQGRDVVDFGSGEPDFDTPEHIKQAAVKALREGSNDGLLRRESHAPFAEKGASARQDNFFEYLS